MVQRPQDNVTRPGSITPDTAPDPPAPAAQPDERPLWRLLSAGQLTELDTRLASLRTAYPGWQPPPRLVALAAAATAERDLARLKAAEDWPALRHLVAAHPELATCSRPDDAATARFSPGAPPADALLSSCPDDAARAAVLAAAFDRFGPSPALVQDLRRLDTAALPPAERTRLSRLRTEIAVRTLGQDLAAKSPATLQDGAALRDTLAARNEAGLQAGLGWAALEAGRPAEAVTWFEAARRSNPAQPVTPGLARALLATGNEAAARTLLAATPGGAATLSALDDARLAAAYRRGDYAAAATLAAARPDPPALLGWSLLRLHRFDAAAAAFEAHVRRHNDQDSALGLVTSLLQAGRPDDAVAAGQRLGGPVAAALAVAPAANGPANGPANGLPNGPDLGYQLALVQLRRALDGGNAPEAARLASTLAGPVLARNDAGAATTLGWAALNADHPAEARIWFSRGTGDDAAYGAALARLRGGDAAGAAAEAASHGNAPRWRRLRQDATMQAAQAQEDAAPGNPATAAAAGAVLAEDPARRDAATLLAWNAAHAGRPAEATTRFEALYRQAPPGETATALAAALATVTDRTRLDGMAAELGGPLVQAARHRAAQDAFNRGEFLAAEQLEPGLNPALANIGAFTAGLSATLRGKSGTNGTSRLDTAATDVFASATGGAAGTDRVTVRLHLISLDAGRNPVSGTTTRLPLGVEPSVTWSREATTAPLLSPFATLGTTPLGGRVAATPVGRAGLGWQADNLTVRATLSRESVTESILSFTGITDGATGRTFGRVTETGAKAEAYLQLAPRWGIYGNVGAGLRDGVGVRDNTHVQAAASLSYDFRVPGFATLTLGPSYGFSGFGRDLSGFTPGEGGYYSPAALHLLGAALRLLTAEGRDFSVRASAFAGLQLAQSDGAADGRGGRLKSTRQDGFNATGEVTAAYRLTERWVLGGMVHYQVSPQFNDVYAGLSLTRSFGPRAALFSADLPRFDLR